MSAKFMITPSVQSQQSINILAFDTSTDVGSIALWSDGKMDSMMLSLGDGVHNQAASLIPRMQELLNKNNISFQDMHVIATTKGPGSFTGIRIAIATLQGLASAITAEVYIPTTFEVAAYKGWVKQPEDYLITISTKRGSYYTQAFNKRLQPLGEGKVMTETQINEFIADNTPIKRFDYTSFGHAEDIVRLYQYRQMNLREEKSATKCKLYNLFTPYYLHNPEFVKQKPCSF